MDVVGTFPTGLSAVEFAAREPVDVAIVDLSMPDLPGIEVVSRLRQSSPGTEVVVLSLHTHPEHVYRALNAGARGYVAKGALGCSLFDAVRTVHARKTYLSDRIDREGVERCFLRHRESEAL